MTSLTVEVSELVNKVTLASKAAATKAVKPILACFLFDISEQGAFVQATDLETSIKAKIVCQSEDHSTFAVDAKAFYELVRSLPDEPANLKFENGVLEIKCGRSCFRVATLDTSEFPEISVSDNGNSLTLERATLLDMIERVLFSAATDEFMRNLNGVYWEIGNGFLRLVASDGFRLALAEEKVANETESGFLLSLKSMKELLSVLANCGDSSVTLNYDGNRLSLTTSEVETVMRVVDVDFPDYRRVLPAAFRCKAVVSKNDLLEALKRASVIAKRGSESVRLDVTEESMLLSSKSPDFGEVSEEVSIQKEGEDITAAFNPRFLTEALRHLHTDEAELNFVDGTSPLQINPLDVEGYLYIVMPIRIV